MTSIRKVALACVAGAMMALPLNAAAQGPANQDTFFTFSQAVELPGKTLPAGTYLFQLADSPSNRHIVKVMSQDRTQLHATLLAIPYYTNERPSDKPQVRFMETPAQAGNGAAGTNAIKIWFYPGNSIGHEFIYPRAQAMQIAARTSQPVLTTTTEADVTDESELARVDRAGANTAVDMTDRPAEQTATAAQTEPMPPADPRPEPATPPAQTAPTLPEPSRDLDREPVRTDLPNTASLLPLLAVIGLGSLVGSRLLRRSRARRAYPAR